MPASTKIQKFNIRGKEYEIIIPKDWNQNDPTAVGYIENRSHFAEIDPSSVVEFAENAKSFTYTLAKYELGDYVLVETEEDDCRDRSGLTPTYKYSVSKLIKVGSLDRTLNVKYYTQPGTITIEYSGGACKIVASGAEGTEDFVFPYKIKVSKVNLHKLPADYLPLDSASLEIDPEGKIRTLRQEELRYAAKLSYDDTNGIYKINCTENSELLKVFLNAYKKTVVASSASVASFVDKTSNEATLEVYFGKDSVATVEIRLLITDEALIAEFDGLLEAEDTKSLGFCTIYRLADTYAISISTTVNQTYPDEATQLNGLCFIADSTCSATGSVMGDNDRIFEIQPGDLLLILDKTPIRLRSTTNLPLNRGTGNGSVIGGAIDTSNVIAIGENSFAFGTNVRAEHDLAIAIGEGLKTSNINQTVLGKYNTEEPSALFIVGKGENNGQRANAIIVDKTGDTTINGELVSTDKLTVEAGGAEIIGSTRIDANGNIIDINSANIAIIGETVIDGKLQVSDDTTEAGMKVYGETYIHGETTITQPVNISDTLTVGKNGIPSEVTIYGNTEIVSGDTKLEISEDTATVTTDKLIVNDTSNKEVVSISSTLTSIDSQEIKLAGATTVNGDVTLNKTLNVEGAVDLDSTLNVDGATTLNTLEVKTGTATITDGLLSANKGLTVTSGTTTDTLNVGTDGTILKADNSSVIIKKNTEIGTSKSNNNLNIYGKLIVQESGAEITGDTSITAGSNALTIDTDSGVSITGELTTSDSLTVQSGGASITGNTIITGTTTSSGRLTVQSGGASVVGTVTLQDKAESPTNKLNLDDTSTTISGTIKLQSTETYPDAQIIVSPEGTGTISASGNTINLYSPSTTINGKTTLKGDTKLTGTFEVTGNFEVSGDTKLNGTTLTVNSTDSTSISGKLIANNTVSCKSDLSVTGNTSLTSLEASGTAEINGAVTLNDSFTVTDILTASKNSGVNISQNTIIGSKNGEKDLTIYGTTTSSNRLTVEDGGASITGATEIDGTITSANTLTVTEGGANITGDTSIVGAVTTTNGLTVDSGGANITGAVNIKGNTDINGTATSTGKLTVGSSNNTPGADIFGATTITGKTTINGEVTINNSLNTTGALVAGSDSEVQGSLVVRDSIITEDLTTNGTIFCNVITGTTSSTNTDNSLSIGNSGEFLYIYSTLAALGNVTVDAASSITWGGDLEPLEPGKKPEEDEAANHLVNKKYVDSLLQATGNEIKIEQDTSSSDNLTIDESTADTFTAITDIKRNVDDKMRLDIKSTTFNLPTAEALFGTLIKMMYPIGSIYMSASNEDPNQLFNGTEWVRWGKGRVPVGVDDSTYSSAEVEGGNETITLSSDNMPEHTHTFTPEGDVSATFSGSSTSTGDNSVGHTHGWSYSGSTGSDGSHSHSVYTGNTGGSGSNKKRIETGNLDGETSTIERAVTTSNGSHSHSISISGTTGNQSANHTHTFTPEGSVSASFAGKDTTLTAGSATPTAIDLRQPYITCYMWKRTA